jgi:hypothetical protein
MPVFIENAVELTAIAKHLKTAVAAVEAECRALNLFIGLAWNHKPAIIERDAYELVSGAARRERDHGQAWRQYAELAEERTKQRDSVYLEATKNRKLRAADRVEAGRKAARRWEEEHPVPQWQDGSTPLASPRYLDSGLFRRTFDRLAGSVS